MTPRRKSQRVFRGKELLPIPPKKIYNLGLKSQSYRDGGHEGLARFRKCSFQGEHPFGTVKLSDTDLPLAVTITGFNPFIPLNDVNSSIPCAIPEYTIHIPSSRTVPYQFSYHLSHLTQQGAETSTRSESITYLFPYLERTLRQREMEESIDARGHINFRPSPPGLPTAHDFHPVAD